MRTRDAQFSHFDDLVDACVIIGNEVSGEDGFVRIECLLNRFGARVYIRPLLVEGMLATIDRPESASESQEKWAVLVDSEKFNLTEDDVRAETANAPLPARFRNTIAHELVHSIAFRSSEFQIPLRNKISNSSQLASLVREIEAETEKLSPLLLCPGKLLENLISGAKSALSIEDLVATVRNFGVSREVLVNRLCMLRPTDSLMNSHGLRNFAVGIGEWQEGGASVLRKWPLFANFDRGLVPEPILKVLAQSTRLHASEAFPDPKFMMCGGTELVSNLEVHAGTRTVPNARTLDIEVAFESGGWRSGEDFLFVVRGLATPKLAAQ